MGLLGDIGGGTSATQNTTTISGSGRQTGKGSLYTESGSIGVGTKGTYTEGGGYNLAGLKLGTGAQLTINESPLNSDALGNIAKLFAANTTPTASGNSAPTSTDSSAPASTSSSTLVDQLKTWLANLTTTQKIGGAVVIVLLAWLIFHRRK